MFSLLLSTDLMFASRVTETAKRDGLQVRVVRSVDELLSSDNVHLVIIDLFRLPVVEWSAAVQQLKQRELPPHIVAYGPHVDEQTLSAAREAGCDDVLTRGQFHQQMGPLLARWLRP